MAYAMHLTVICTGGKAKMPNHYRCTSTCAFCGRHKHYEDECYPKKRLNAPNGEQKQQMQR